MPKSQNETRWPSEKCSVIMLHQNYIHYPKNVKESIGVNATTLLGTFKYLFLSFYVLISFWDGFLKYVTQEEVFY